MITINLLPEQKRARVANVEKEVVLFALVLILVGFGLFFTQQWITGRVEALRTVQEQKNAQKLKLLKKIGHINNLQKKSRKAKQYIKVIKSIRVKQGRPVHFLDELVSNLPQDQIWFESLNLRQDGHIDLRGIALDNQIFATYVKKIRKSNLIDNVILHQTSRKTIREYNLVAFRCRIKAGSTQAPEGKDG